VSAIAPRRLIELNVALTFALDLPAPPATVGAAFEARELSRDEVVRILGPMPSFARSLENLDAVAPGGWRCFAVFDGGAPIHVNFISLRPGRIVLFGGSTDPARRGRGAFRVLVAHVAGVLAAEGAKRLFSTAAGGNRASMRAHQAAGFRVVQRRFDLWIRGTSLRHLARTLLRRRGRARPA
jgi:RimJ/RimL family protein N-acetyltransferase